VGPAPTSPKQSSRDEPSMAEYIGRAHIRAVMALRDPRRPARPTPRLIRRALPDPLASYEQWLRFSGQDVTTMSRTERAHERRQLLVAAALASDQVVDIPTWLWSRVRLLQGARP
jgi:hypothetical protein